MLHSPGSLIDALLRATLSEHRMQMQGEGEVYTLMIAAIYRGTLKVVEVAKLRYLPWRVLRWKLVNFYINWIWLLTIQRPQSFP